MLNLTKIPVDCSMKEKFINCVLLVDDDKATNFFNKRIALKNNQFDHVNSVQSGKEALLYLEDARKKLVPKPELIFLDVNMPAMNGWEFLEQFSKLDDEIKENVKIIMLTTSTNPKDLETSKNIESVNDFVNKPLSVNLLDHILDKHFSNR